eukprot:TRINITY_DN2558_c0_g1_i2.p1 TRINITY_DN2558_c0_g1~~TRINITY_DN2558_c0_g1_i2.p1  ORF type:complete len:119 (+),score=12.66 TRINITY_DN2558_c0_g1_i2:73-429(+)
MQAFKAANPGCVMEDFVRWHSPSDWVQEPKAIFKEKQKATDEKEKETEAPKNNQELPIRPWDMGDGTIGYLSYRMRVADSLWIRKWNVCTFVFSCFFFSSNVFFLGLFRIGSGTYSGL